MRPAPADAACPCGRADAKGHARLFSNCCEPFIAQFETRPAPDAESLMRSRYSAFVTGNTAYLLATWHPATRPRELETECGVRWLGLQVRSHRCVDAGHAEVEFVARSRRHGRGARLHERSRFVREADGRWYYLDGAML